MMSRLSGMRAFTLIETLIAVSILTIAIIGPFAAIQNALVASYVARDTLTASMLAQEGIEYVRAVRDENYIYIVANPGTTRGWFYGLDSSGGVNCVNRLCTVDPTKGNPFQSGAVQVCGTGTGPCPVLRQSASNFLFTQDLAHPATVFTRSVTLTSVSSTEMRVTSTVTWSTGHKQYSITLTEVLSAWL